MRLFLGFLLLATPLMGSAVDLLREQEINECRAGDIALWPDGSDRSAVASPLVFSFEATGTPAWFDPEEISALIRKAAGAWSACGIPARISDQYTPAPGSIRIRWDEAGSRGNFALANLSASTLSLSPAAFALLRQRNPGHDARETLQMVISHEMGHFYGLMAHSRRCIDVLSYYQNERGESCFSRNPDGRRQRPEYRHVLPTACDIERCRRANGFLSR